MVQLKKKVTIKTKTAQEETPVAAPKPEVKIKKKAPVTEEPKVTSEEHKAPMPPPTPPTPPEENGGSKSWMWIVALIVVAVIAFFGYKGCSGLETEASGSDKDTTSLVSDSTQTEKSDSTEAEKPETTDEGAAMESQDNGNETDAPAIDNGTPKANNGGTDAAKSEQKPAETAKPVSTSKNVDKPVVPTAPISGSVEENARRVIRGDFGNGEVRKQDLGDQYLEIQSKVNEMYRQRKGH